MGRVFKTRYFARWMRETALTDRALCVAVREMAGGLIDADLGGGVIKKRVALPGRGKRGSTRTLLATNRQDRWFFLFGLEKNDRANISERELDALQALADDLLKLDSRQLDAQVDNLALDEICDENQV
jgi:hypothetical protein